MFGYVTVNKPELKIKEYDTYRMYYCGVCHALRETDGMLGQLSLTYDSAFVAVLLTALYEPDTKRKQRACVVHPIGKKTYLKNEAIDYAADMNLLLAYYKCLDDWVDDRKFSRLVYSKAIRKKVKKTGKKYEKKVVVIRERLHLLSVYEKENEQNLDLLSGLFGDIMAEIIGYYPGYGEDWSRELHDIGYLLGKFIYILDAYDDLEEDMKTGQFNPCISKYQTMKEAAFREYIKELLMLIAADMAKLYERLPIVSETGILRNIIYSGIWVRFDKKQEAVKKRNPESKERKKK